MKTKTILILAIGLLTISASLSITTINLILTGQKDIDKNSSKILELQEQSLETTEQLKTHHFRIWELQTDSYNTSRDLKNNYCTPVKCPRTMFPTSSLPNNQSIH